MIDHYRSPLLMVIVTVSFIDDYSRMTWLYLLKNRFEMLNVFISFYNKIKTQFSMPIKIFRTGNTLEYLSMFKPSWLPFLTIMGLSIKLCVFIPLNKMK